MAEWMNVPAQPLVAGTQSVEKRLPNDLLVTVTPSSWGADVPLFPIRDQDLGGDGFPLQSVG